MTQNNLPPGGDVPLAGQRGENLKVDILELYLSTLNLQNPYIFAGEIYLIRKFDN